MSVTLSATMEDYLEAIFEMDQAGQTPTVTALARRLSVKKPTVTYALNTLRDAGLIRYKPYGRITITTTGSEVGQRILNRHLLLRGFLVDVLAVPAEVAENDACRMEHVLSPQTLAHLTRFVAFLGEAGRSDLVGEFHALLDREKVNGQIPVETGSVDGGESIRNADGS